MDQPINESVDATNPLIWTAVGYVREREMQHTVEWEEKHRHIAPPRWKFWRMGIGYPVFAGIILIDRYHLNGVLVKESRHIYKTDGVQAESQSQEFQK